MLNVEARPYKVFSRKAGNWHQRHGSYEIIVNTTASGTFDSASPMEKLDGVRCVVDLSLKPGDLQAKCEAENIDYVSGLDFYKWVFLRQFQIYTDIEADAL